MLLQKNCGNDDAFLARIYIRGTFKSTKTIPEGTRLAVEIKVEKKHFVHNLKATRPNKHIVKTCSSFLLRKRERDLAATPNLMIPAPVA